LGPEQEPPPPVRISNGSGFGTVVLDSTETMLSVNMTWQDLNVAAAASHIHCCAGPGFNAGVAIDFVPAGFPSAISGSFSHVFDLTDAASYGAGFLTTHSGDVDAARSAVVAGLLGGLTYLNIHTPMPLGYPGGEIRGQLHVIPEPSSALLLLAAPVVFILRNRFARSKRLG
jgi:hypothetical protein